MHLRKIRDSKIKRFLDLSVNCNNWYVVNSDINGCGVRGDILQNLESIWVQFPI